MDIFANNIDILNTYEGDIEFANGDIRMTNGVDLLKRKIFKILSTEPGEWKLAPQEGGSPIRFIGEPNTRDLATQMSEYISNKLDPHILPASAAVRIVPINHTEVKCYIDINILGLTVAAIPFTMDLVNGILKTDIDEEVDTLVAGPDIKPNDSSSLTNPNPFWNRLRR